MKFIKKNIKLISILVLIVLTTSLIFLKIHLNNNKKLEIEEQPPEEEPVIEKEEEQTKIENIYIDIKGAIKKPGVYEMESDKKVIDVVNKAGGLTDNADTSMINLAKKLTNEMVVIIYTKEEVEKYQKQEEIIKVIDKECICPEITNDACINTTKTTTNTKETSTTSNNTTNTNSTEKININKATLEELQTLTGIGESKAEAIIKYREEHGAFESIEAIKEVSGIGETLYEKIKNNITI